jgi:hypothetical protein
MVNRISTSVSKLRMLRTDAGGAVIASAIGSGFFWEVAGQPYLITNWHNVTGINPDTNKMMDQFIPNKLEFTYSREPPEKPGMVHVVAVALDLYADDVPQWLEHPLGREIDCVAISLNFSASHNFKSIAMNKHSWDVDLEAEVGMECFIIGYPQGLTGAATTPIWKRASIASEPQFNHDGKPLLLVDTASRKGMSGSPVIMRHHGYFAPGGKTEAAWIGTGQNFLGIYSGRLGEDELGVQLGRIWKGHIVDEVISAAKCGVHTNDVL